MKYRLIEHGLIAWNEIDSEVEFGITYIISSILVLLNYVMEV